MEYFLRLVLIYSNKYSNNNNPSSDLTHLNQSLITSYANISKKKKNSKEDICIFSEL